jgi:ATP-dependent RNA circularization protein (DNA/RNA ligase family)
MAQTLHNLNQLEKDCEYTMTK